MAKSRLARAISATIGLCGIVATGFGINMLTSNWRSVVGLVLVVFGVLFGSGGLVWIVVEFVKDRKAKAQPPTIRIQDAILTWEQFADAREGWGFAVSFVIETATGNRLFFVGSDCHAWIMAPKEYSQISFSITLCYTSKNEGPQMPSVRADEEPAMIAFSCRHLGPSWHQPLPDRVLARVTLVDASRKGAYERSVLLCRDDPSAPRWVGFGDATDGEIAEFSP